MSQRLGDLLVKEKVITPEQLEQAMKVQKETHVRLALGVGQARLPFRRRRYELSFTPVWRSGNQPFLFRNRSIGRKAHSLRNCEAIPDSAAEPCRCVAHHCDGRSDQRVRHGRHQVHDRLQHRAGGSVGELDSGRDR